MPISSLIPEKFYRTRFYYLEYFTKLEKKDFETIKSEKTPVILVAGIYGSARSLVLMKKFLEEHGYPVYLLSDKKNIDPVPVLAKRLEKKILKIPAKKIQIVAHSMGGITTLKALQSKKVFEKVARVITIGSPLNGCFFGKLAFWEKNKNQKWVSSSEEVKSLSSDKKINKKIYSLYAEIDEVVFPYRSSILIGAGENKKIKVKGHAGLILAEKSWEEVLKRLKR